MSCRRCDYDVCQDCFKSALAGPVGIASWKNCSTGERVRVLPESSNRNWKSDEKARCGQSALIIAVDNDNTIRLEFDDGEKKWFKVGKCVKADESGAEAGQTSTTPGSIKVFLAGVRIPLAQVQRLICEDLRGIPCGRAPVFLLTKLEVLDALSDGLTCASALYITVHERVRFEQSFAQSASFIRCTVAFLGLPGLMFVAVLVAIVSQLGTLLGAAVSAPHDTGLATAARDFAGFSPVARVTRRPEGPDVDPGALLSSLARTLCEGIPQILLQSSLLMVVGQSLLEEPLLLTSLALSLLTSLRKVLETTRTVAFALAKIGPEMCQRGDFFFLAIWGLIPILALWLLLALAVWRTTMLQLCPCHMWGISTGCMVLK